MKKSFLVLICLCCGFFGLAPKDWATKTAQRLERRDAEYFNGSNGLADALVKEDWVKRERIKNTRKYVIDFVEIAKDIDEVLIGKTQDADTYVVTIIDTKNNRASLWLTKENIVYSITPY